MYYVIILMALILLVWNQNYKRVEYKLFGVCFLFLVIFVGCFRDTTIGTDIALNDDGYHMIWQHLFNYPRDIEPGFIFLTSFIKFLFPSYYFYYGVIFLFNIFFYCKAAKLLGINKYLLIAIILLGGLLAPSFNVVRQMLGLSLGLWIYAFILDKYNKNKLNALNAILLYEILIIATGFLFHKSLFLLVIIPVFYFEFVKKMLDKDTVLWSLFGASLFITIAGGEYIRLVLILSEGLFGERGDFWANNYLMYGDYAEESHGYMTNVVNGTLAILLSRKHREPLFYIGFVGMLIGGIASSGMGTIGRMFDNLSMFLLFFWAKNWFSLNCSKYLFSCTNMFKTFRVLFWLSSLYFTLLSNESLNPYQLFIFK